MYTLIHHNNCSKSNAALNYLQTTLVPFTIRNYIAHPLNAAEIEALLQQLQLPINDIIRTTVDLWKNNFAGQQLNHSELLVILEQNPSLLQRPILVYGEKAIIARPPELVCEFIAEQKKDSQ